jgi:hypothetical protein
MADCRKFSTPANPCSMVFIGEEQELLDAVVAHAVSKHGHEDTPSTRQEIAESLEPAEQYED